MVFGSGKRTSVLLVVAALFVSSFSSLSGASKLPSTAVDGTRCPFFRFLVVFFGNGFCSVWSLYFGLLVENHVLGAILGFFLARPLFFIMGFFWFAFLEGFCFSSYCFVFGLLRSF